MIDETERIRISMDRFLVACKVCGDGCWVRGWASLVGSALSNEGDRRWMAGPGILWTTGGVTISFLSGVEAGFVARCVA